MGLSENPVTKYWYLQLVMVKFLPRLWVLATVKLLVLSCVAFSATGTEAFIGTIKIAQGIGSLRRGVETTPIREGMQLLLNDVLETSSDGRVGIILQDGTRIALGPNTELKVDRLVYQPAEGKFGMVLRLGHGVLAYISGRIAQYLPESVSIVTPIGVIGVRGTTFAVSIEGG